MDQWMICACPGSLWSTTFRTLLTNFQSNSFMFTMDESTSNLLCLFDCQWSILDCGSQFPPTENLPGSCLLYMGNMWIYVISLLGFSGLILVWVLNQLGI